MPCAMKRDAGDAVWHRSTAGAIYRSVAAICKISEMKVRRLLTVAVSATTVSALGAIGQTLAPAAASARGVAASAPRDDLADFAVSATDNIWGAGLLTPPDPGGGGGGTLPFARSLPAGTSEVKLSAVTGTVSYGAGESNGPDGQSGQSAAHISGYGGISGLTDSARYFYLVGVFLAKGQPAKPPPTLDFTSDHSFEELSPRLGQVFFIGDGLTGTGIGENQHFVVPDDATAIYLGFADAVFGSGPPGAYGDNTGSVAGQLHFVSEG